MMATLAGIGVARFAYTPLIPALVQQHWFDASAAAYLGAANLLGYLLGALGAHRVSERYGARPIMAVAFVAITLSFVLCARPAPFAWFFVWRLVSGVAGAALVVVGPSIALTSVSASRRAVVAPLVFMGIGLGALLSALVTPWLLHVGLSATWLALGALCLTATVIGDRAMARLPAPPESASGGQATMSTTARAAVVLVIVAYALDAAGYVPHTVFWVDYLAREVGLGIQAASLQWALFGVGAVMGPFLVGLMVTRLGWHRSLATGFTVKTLAVALPLVTLALPGRCASSLLVGAMVPGIVTLTSGRLAELVGPESHKRIWGRATAAFAAAQAFAGYGMSGLYAAIDSYRPLFVIGAVVLLLGTLSVLVSGAPPSAPHRIRRKRS